jgi:hypothetical protein
MRKPKEELDPVTGTSHNIEACEIPLLSDFLNPILIDMDPEQGMEEEYKRKNNQVFVFRYLRQISFMDLVNFHGRPENYKTFQKFEGNCEEQAMIMYNRNKRRLIEFAGDQANK